MINAIGEVMYVMSGEFPDNDKCVTRTLWGNSYDNVVARLKRMHPSIHCINIDVLCEATASNYNVTYTKAEQLVINYMK